eukprot:GHVT01077270.1.p1 GENE.GHVT01077270.1~~GHVT01077270.1.p1  ORF type:complete len:146 (+),score=27.26 GHVT01077270.1:626-1063(+)
MSGRVTRQQQQRLRRSSTGSGGHLWALPRKTWGHVGWLPLLLPENSVEWHSSVARPASRQCQHFAKARPDEVIRENQRMAMVQNCIPHQEDPCAPTSAPPQPFSAAPAGAAAPSAGSGLHGVWLSDLANETPWSDVAATVQVSRA